MISTISVGDPSRVSMPRISSRARAAPLVIEPIVSTHRIANPPPGKQRRYIEHVFGWTFDVGGPSQARMRLSNRCNLSMIGSSSSTRGGDCCERFCRPCDDQVHIGEHNNSVPTKRSQNEEKPRSSSPALHNRTIADRRPGAGSFDTLWQLLDRRAAEAATLKNVLQAVIDVIFFCRFGWYVCIASR